MEQQILDGMYEQLGISKEVLDYAADIEESLKERFEGIDQVAEYNQLKVLKGMQDNKVSDIHFAATTGYGYNDLGRDTLEDVYASVFHTESALVRPQLISGTHALHIALSGNLRPGDELLSPVGKPYDTLEEVIGIRDSVGSLMGQLRTGHDGLLHVVVGHGDIDEHLGISGAGPKDLRGLFAALLQQGQHLQGGQLAVAGGGVL